MGFGLGGIWYSGVTVWLFWGGWDLVVGGGFGFVGGFVILGLGGRVFGWVWFEL